MIAPTDNDKYIVSEWRAYGLDKLQHRIAERPHRLALRSEARRPTATTAGFSILRRSTGVAMSG